MRHRISFLFAVLLLLPTFAYAEVVAQPPLVEIRPTQVSDQIDVTVRGGTRIGVGTLTITGLPPGARTVPREVQYAPERGEGRAEFRIYADATTAPGTYPITIATDGLGQTTITLRVIGDGTFEASATPNPLILSALGDAKNVTVTTSMTGGGVGPIHYTFNALPGFIQFGGPRTVDAPGGYAPVVFPFTIAPNSPEGTYVGALTATAGATTKTYPFTVIVQRPALAASFTQPSVRLCNDGTIVSNALVLQPSGGYAGTPTITPQNVPAGIALTPINAPAPLPPAATIPFSLSATNATPGNYVIGVRIVDAANGIDQVANLNVTVTASDFTPTLNGSASIVAGGPPATLTAGASVIGCFSAPIAVTVSGAPAGVTITTSGMLLPPSYAPATITIQASASTPPGVYPINVTFAPASAGSLTASATAKTLVATLTVTAPPDFALQATPPALTVVAGSSSTVSVSVTASGGFSGPVNITASAASPLTINPAAFTLQPGSTQVVTLAAPASATPTTLPVVFTGTGAGVSGARTAQVIVSIGERAPALIAAAPTSVATGTRSQLIRLTAANLRSNATITTTRGDVTIESFRILAEDLAEVVLSVRSDAAAGPIAFVATNPGGIRSNAASINVIPSSSLGAPLSISAASIVYPASGTSFTSKDAIYPRGLLATTGTGAVAGTWLLDGVPFDRFVITVGGGMPAEVRSHVPVPWGVFGSHRLELAIDAPMQAISPAVDLIMSAQSVSRLMVFAPRDGTVLTPDTLFRWSLVPNASGYIVEFEPRARIRLSDAEWRPTERQLASLRGGIRRWRVIPVFAGETEGEPTEWRRIAILPEKVALVVDRPVAENGGVVLRWRGGVSGVIYRVDILDAAGNILSSALTASESFTVRSLPQGARVRVTAIGPGGVILGASTTPSSSSALGSQARYAQSSAVAVTAQEPQNGATIHETQPRVSATWSGAVRATQVALLIDGMDVTAVAELTPISITYDSLLPLDAGTHDVQLTLGETVTKWQFRIDTTGAAGVDGSTTPAQPGAPATPRTTSPRVRRDWAIAPAGTITVVDSNIPGSRDETRAQISANTDLAANTAGVKMAGDVSVRHDLQEPRQTVQESRSWVTSLNGKQASTAQELRAGYAVPAFLDQSELMTLGAARGGVSASVIVPGLRASYYQTFSSRPVGVVAGNFGPEQKIQALALQLPASSAWDFRILAMNVDEEPGVYTPGGKGRSIGIFSRYVVSPLLAVNFEAARGSFDTRGGVENEGDAFRLGLSGSKGTLLYTLNLRRTNIGYTNPANRGFTPGAVSDRTGGDLLVSKMFGRASTSVQLRHLQDGTSSGAALPRTKETGVLASFSAPIGSRLTLSLTGNTTRDKGDGNHFLALPRTDRRMNSFSATMTETVGRFSLSQTFVQQMMRDRVSSLNDATIRTGTLSAAGTLWPSVSLSALVSGTRSEGSVIVGDTEVVLASLQPSFTIAPLQLTLQPRVTWSRTELSLADLSTELEQYQMVVMWSPRAFSSFASIQISADWNRTSIEGQPTPRFDRRYIGALSLRWGASGGNAAATAPVVLPPDAQHEPYAENTPLKSASQ